MQRWILGLLGALAAVAANPSSEPCLQPDRTCSEKLAIGTAGKFVLIYRNYPLDATLPNVERLLVMVHGATRNGDGYYATALASAVASGQLMNTLIVAPSFRGNDGQSCKDPYEETELYWGCQLWNAGFRAQNGTETSFDAMDRIVAAALNKDKLPNLKEVLVVGHSGGGQYVQRYAAMNRMESRLDVPMRYVAANPSSYVYLNDLRLRSDASCTVDGKCSGAFTPYWDRANCTGFNKYRYGLESLAGYAATVGAEPVRKQFPARNVTYLIGDLDNLQDTDLDKGCAAQAQGPNRRERGVTYWSYMKTHYKANHKLVMVPRCGHNANCMFVSPAGVRTLFPKQ